MRAKSSAKRLPGLETLEGTPRILESLLTGATQEALVWKPGAARWSISEVLAHLVEVETNVMRVRARRMAEEDAPELEPYDQNGAYAAGKYYGLDARTSLERFRTDREASLAWLRTLPAASAERTGKHQELGIITLGQLMNEWAFHDLGHTRQLIELLRARAFWPNMGAFQQYYRINP